MTSEAEEMSASGIPEGVAPGLEVALAALRRDYSKLLPRLRSLDHTVTCECDKVVLRLHFPALRQGKATVQELIDVIAHFMIPFTLPRSEINKVDELFNQGNLEEFKLRYLELSERAKALFKRANKATNRNGEAGELLLYLLTEWMLEAPQLVAKMSLKTNREMAVHGSDGIHVRYLPDQGRLLMFWGESKLYANVSDAISAALTSIVEALEPHKLKHEIELVQRNISFAGLNDASKDALLKYLDPYDEAYNERHDITTCLLGFNFDGFDKVASSDQASIEVEFRKLAEEKLTELAPKLASALTEANLADHPIEIFLLPVPSVQELRDIFQAKIGWK